MSATLPIVVLSARDCDFDIVAGLRLGADDYLTKDAGCEPAAPGCAHRGALPRRSELSSAPPDAEDVLARGPLALDVEHLTADWRGRRVDLRAYRVLGWCIRSPATRAT